MKTRYRTLQAGEFEVLEQGYSPGYRGARHDHPAAEFCLALSGSVTEAVDHGDTLVCRSGEATFKPPAAHHRVSIGTSGARFLVVTVPPERVSHDRLEANALHGPLAFPAGALTNIAARLLRELEVSDAHSPLAAEGIALELLATAARKRSDDSWVRAPAWLRATRDRLHDEARTMNRAPPTLRELAASANVAPTCLAQAFRRAYGTSVGSYARRLRLDHAQILLASGERSLSEVALECGFYDQSHFTRVFRREIGVTPASFRRQHRSG